jgi:hypothetical protein
VQSWTGVGKHDPARVQALWLSALGVDPQLYDNDVGHAARDPLAGTCSHKPSQYQRRAGTDQESIEFGCVKGSVYPINRLGLAHVLLRVNRRGFFYPLLLLSLFDRSRGGDYRLIQHFKIGNSASRPEPWS